MIGKIVKGTSFSGCVNYVLKEDKSRLLKAVGVYGSPEEIAEQFELQTLLNDKVKNTVGHILLSFSAEDGDRIRDDDGLMLKIAHDYMKLMGIENTQFIIARHTDRDHPHCHIVYNRVDNDGRTISDKNDRYRNEKVCKILTARYRLHFAEGKEHVMGSYHSNLEHGAGLIMLSHEYFSFFADRKAAEEPMIKMACAMGIERPQSGEDFIRALDDLIASVGCTDLKMSDYGITREEIKKWPRRIHEVLGGDITADPLPLSDEDYLGIYERSFK